MGSVKQILGILLLISILPAVFAATSWQSNPANCPNTDLTNYPGQNCAEPTEMCGDLSGAMQCYDTDTIAAPGVDLNSTTDQFASYNGGYLVNCYATVDALSPFCDNSTAAWCDRNSTCQNVNRTTTCKASLWAYQAGGSICSGCTPPYIACDGSTTDVDGCEVNPSSTNCAVGSNNNLNSSCTCVCDSGYNDCDASGAGAGNGCEIQNGSACTVGTLSGTYSTCTCVVAKQYFQTGTMAEYNSDENFLWGRNYSVIGNLINIFNPYSSQFFRVDANTNITSRSFAATNDVNANRFCFVGGACATSWAAGGGGSSYQADQNFITLNQADNNKFGFNEAAWDSNIHTYSATQNFLDTNSRIATALDVNVHRDQNISGKLKVNLDVNLLKNLNGNDTNIFLDKNGFIKWKTQYGVCQTTDGNFYYGYIGDLSGCK